MIFTEMMSSVKKKYYSKAYLVKFIDGTYKLIGNNIQTVSYQQVRGPEGEIEKIPFTTDHYVYSSKETKYGTMPCTSVMWLEEVKTQKQKDGIHVFNNLGKELMVM